MKNVLVQKNNEDQGRLFSQDKLEIIEVPDPEKSPFTVNEEFRSLQRPLTDHEFAELEADIGRYSCLIPLLVYKDRIIDGMHRERICRELKIGYNVIKMHFESELEAKIYIIKSQRGRRNLNSDEIDINIASAYNLYQENPQYARGQNDHGRLADFIASMFNCSTSKVTRCVRFKKSIDYIATIYANNIGYKILRGEIKLNKSDVNYIASFKDIEHIKECLSKMERLHDELKSQENIDYNDISYWKEYNSLLNPYKGIYPRKKSTFQVKVETPSEKEDIIEEQVVISKESATQEVNDRISMKSQADQDVSLDIGNQEKKTKSGNKIKNTSETRLKKYHSIMRDAHDKFLEELEEFPSLKRDFYNCKRRFGEDWKGCNNQFNIIMSDYFVSNSSQEQNQDDDLLKDEYDDSDEWYKMF